MATASSSKVLISFDVDGTLIHTVGKDANKLHKLAFQEAWRACFQIDTTLDVIQHHGLTDPLILIKVLQHHGIPTEKAAAKLKEMEAVMIKFYEANADKAGMGLETLPGVKQMLEELMARGDVLTCLVTGNLEPIGWAKMQALGLKQLFSEPHFGGFGSDYCNPENANDSWKDRAELVRIAAHKAKKLYPGSELDVKWHVGDTPMDVQAAQGGGAEALGVLTGVYSQEVLQEANPKSIILKDLQNVAEVLQTFGLS